MVKTLRTSSDSMLIDSARIDHLRCHDGDGLEGKVLDVLLHNAEHTLVNPPPAIGEALPTSGCFQVQNRLLLLAAAFRLTDDGRYYRAAFDTVQQLSEGKWNSSTLNDEVRVAYALVGVLVLADLTRGDHDSSEAQSLYATACEMADWLYDGSKHATYGESIPRRLAWNHSVVPAAAVATFALVYPGNGRSTEMEKWGHERVVGWLKNGISPQGVCLEGLFYAGFVFRILGIYLQFARSLQRIDFTDPDIAAPFNKLREVPNWYLHNVYPAGSFLQNHNDSTTLAPVPMFGWLLTFSELRPMIAASVWNALLGDYGQKSYGGDHSMAGQSSFEAAFFYPFEHQQVSIDSLPNVERKRALSSRRSGIVFSRSGWSKDDSAFTFKSSHHVPGIHGQSDANSFTFMGNGVPLVIDAGAANNPNEGSASSSYGHSAILIDGKGQRPGGMGKGASGNLLLHRELGHDRLICAGDAAMGYGTDNYNPVRRAFRHVLVGWSPAPFVLVCDDIVKDDAWRAYDFIFQTLDFEPEWTNQQGFGGLVKFGQRTTPLSIECAQPVLDDVRHRTTKAPQPFGARNTWFLSAACNAPGFVVLIAACDRSEFVLSDKVDGQSVEVSISWSNGDSDRIVLGEADDEMPAPRVLEWFHGAGDKAIERLTRVECVS